MFRDFGKKLGLAFQIKDDILDIEGTLEEVGKSVGGEKKGFVYLLGVHESKKVLCDLIAECKMIGKKLRSKKIDFMIDYIEARKY